MKTDTLVRKIAEAKEALANTGDKDVDAFLNGDTNDVPEGTTEITEDEAKKLLEGADGDDAPAEDGEDAPDLGQDDGVVG